MVFARDADAGVAHLETQVDCIGSLVEAPHAQHDLTIARELHRVRQEVQERLPQADGVTLHGTGHVWFAEANELDALSARDVAEQARDSLHPEAATNVDLLAIALAGM